MASDSDRISKCRAHSDQCRAWADLTTHESAKRTFLEAAAQWDRLAQEIADIAKMAEFVAAQRTPPAAD